MRLILTNDVYEVGHRGEIVDVADGFGRNFLIPRKLAVPATAGNIRMVEQQRVAMAKKESKHVEEAEILAQELKQSHVLISRKSGESGVLFGSVTSKDISDVLEANGVNLDRRRILLGQPIKALGNFEIEAHPHNDVEATLLVSVVPEDEEPVGKMIPRGQESDKIIESIEAKLAEIEKLTGTTPEAE